MLESARRFKWKELSLKSIFDVDARATTAEPLPDAQWGGGGRLHIDSSELSNARKNKNSSFKLPHTAERLLRSPPPPPLSLCRSSSPSHPFFNKTHLPVSHCAARHEKNPHLKKVITTQELMRFSVVSLMYYWAAAVVSGCSQLNATGFTLSSLILGILYPDTQQQDPVEVYSLAALIPEGDLVLTE